MNKIQKTQLIGLLTFIVVTISGIYIYKYFMLSDTNETFAIFKGRNVGVGITQKYFEYKTDNGKLVKASVVYKEELEEGDTVWIEYSILNPSVIRVLDKDYSKH